MSSSGRYLVLLRHGETEWTISGRHTGRSDIELTEAGREEARAAGRRLEGMKFDRVVTSPMHRAVETCRLAGFGDGATTDDALMEWDYGEYEGITTAEIQETVPDWSLFVQGCPGGESAADVGARVDPLVDAAREGEGNWLFAAHGHVLTPGRYVGAEEVEDDGEPFEEKMPRLVAELHAQFAESAKLEKTIKANLKGLGYGG